MVFSLTLAHVASTRSSLAVLFSLCVSHAVLAQQTSPDELRQALTSANPRDQMFGLIMLREQQQIDLFLPELRPLLESEDAYVRRLTVRALRGLSSIPIRLTSFQALLRDSHASIRWEAITGLGLLAHDAQPAIPALLEIYDNSTSRSERTAIRYALVRSQGEAGQVLPRVLAAADSSGSQESHDAVSALAIHHSAGAVRVQSRMAEIAATTPSERTAEVALSALWQGPGILSRDLVEHILAAFTTRDNAQNRRVAASLTPRFLNTSDTPSHMPTSETLDAFGSPLVPATQGDRTRIVEVLSNQLLTESFTLARAAICEALEQFADPRSRTALIDFLLREEAEWSGDRSDILHAIDALGATGPAAYASSAQLLSRLLASNDQYIVTAAVDALGRMGSSAGGAVTSILSAYKRDYSHRTEYEDGDQLRVAVYRTIVAIEPPLSDPFAAFLSRVDSGVDLSEFRLILDALVSLGESSVRLRRTHDAEWIRRADRQLGTVGLPASNPHRTRLREAAANLRTLRLSWWTAVVASLASVALGIVVFGRAQRRVLSFFGYGWGWRTGTCEHRFDAITVEERVVVNAQTPNHPRSTVFRVTFPSISNVASNEHTRLLAATMRTGELGMVIAAEELFRIPWPHLFGGAWTTEGAIVGQVCVGSRVVSSPPKVGKLRLGIVVASRVEGYEQLLMAPYEVDEIARIFRRWGAAVHNNGVGTAPAVMNALATCEIVHIAAHALPDRLVLSDRALHASDFATADLRCKLLVLSACDAAQLGNQNNSLVMELVRKGVNVIAARASVSDQVCRYFFAEFYRALLPKRGLASVEIGRAISEAVVRCAKLMDGDEWRVDVDSMILFGDPTLKLVQVRRSGTDGRGK